MADPTTRFSLRRSGQDPQNPHFIEPRDWDALVDIADSNLPASPSVPTVGSSPIAITSNTPHALRLLRLTLTNLVISVANANDYGSQKLYDFANNQYFVAARMNLTCVKGNVTNGILDASTAVKIGVGSAAASNATLSGTMVDILDKVTLAGTHSATAVEHSNDNASPAVKFYDNTNSAFLNVETGNITADDTLTVSGIIDFFYFDLGADTAT